MVYFYRDFGPEDDHSVNLKILRYALREEYGVTEEPVLEKNAVGKPVMNLPYEFNFSHNGGACVCGLSRECIGVDVQKITEVRPSVVKRVFSPSEQTVVAQAEDQSEIFTAIWTRKEAFGKYSGKGICYDMSSTDFGKPCRIGELILETHRIGEYYLSICSKTVQPVVVLTTL